MSIQCRSARLALAAAMLCCVLNRTAPAQDAAGNTTEGAVQDAVRPLADAQATRMIRAFKTWAKKWNVPNTSIAIMRGTTLIGSYGKGTHTPTTPVGVASESKAITAICIAKLVEDKKFSFNSRLNALLSDYFVAHPPKDSRVKGITVGDLLTHSSGITYDPSQGSDGGKIEELPLGKVDLARQATITFKQELGTTPGSNYFYNNMNYALLGLIIETVTGTSYEHYCYQNVLKPAGVTPTKLIPQWRELSSWAGWKISAVNYARFLAYFLPSQRLLNIPVSTWPKYSFGDGSFYTLGAFMRVNPNGPGHNFWHDGSWSWDDPAASFGGYYTVIGQNVRYMANYEPTISDTAVNDLDSVMYDAAIGVTGAKLKLKPHEIADH
jgi:CubicO group peptidase (beta-lactamase class C family)